MKVLRADRSLIELGIDNEEFELLGPKGLGFRTMDQMNGVSKKVIKDNLTTHRGIEDQRADEIISEVENLLRQRDIHLQD